MRAARGGSVLVRLGAVLALGCAAAATGRAAPDPTPASLAERAADAILAAAPSGTAGSNAAPSGAAGSNAAPPGDAGSNAARGAGLDAALDAVAKGKASHAWLVVDALCGRGRADVADDLAGRVAPPEGPRLRAYVATRRGRPADAEARRRVEAAEAKNDARASAAALEAVAGLEDLDGVLGARVHAERGTALRRLGRPAEAHVAYAMSAARAEAIAWWGWAADVLAAASDQARAARDDDAARRAAARLVEAGRAAPDPVREGDGWLQTAHLELRARAYPAAGRAFERARTLYERHGEARGVGLALAMHTVLMA